MHKRTYILSEFDTFLDKMALNRKNVFKVEYRKCTRVPHADRNNNNDNNAYV